MARRALICGISGQDGTYLTELLLGKGYEVTGTSRDAERSEFRNLEAFGLALVTVDCADDLIILDDEHLFHRSSSDCGLFREAR